MQIRRENRLFILLVVCFFLLNIYAFSTDSSRWELRIAVEKANILLEPDIESAIVTTMPKGSILQSYEKAGEWFRIIIGPDEEGFVVIGYIHSSAVEIISEKSMQEPDFWEEEPGFFQGIGLSVKLTGGLNYFSGGDIDEGTRGLYDLAADYISSIGYTIERRTKPFHNGYGIMGDIIFNFSPKIGIGIGLGYIFACEQSFLTFSKKNIGPEGYLFSSPRISVVPIRLGLFFILPLHRLFNVSFNGGTALYLTEYSYGMQYKIDDMETIYHKANAKALGFHGGIGFEIILSPRAVFFIEGQGRYAKITNFKGTTILRKDTYLMGSVIIETIVSKKEGMLYYLEGNKYPSLAILEGEPSEYKTVRKAAFDFSGFTFQAGLRIKF